MPGTDVVVEVGGWSLSHLHGLDLLSSDLLDTLEDVIGLTLMLCDINVVWQGICWEVYLIDGGSDRWIEGYSLGPSCA